MKFGLILPTYLTLSSRVTIAEHSYASLRNTVLPPNLGPLPFYVIGKDVRSNEVFLRAMAGCELFDLRVFEQPGEVPRGVDSPIAWITDRLFGETECSHVIELADDMVYHPRWFIELVDLVGRHPNALAWSVYRSAHTRHHKTIQQDAYGDHLVTSMAGNGTCWTREEWAEWGIKWQDGPSWPVPSGGDTLDLHHAYFRPGERWATDASFMDHIGNIGVHCQSGTPEHALCFVGEQ